MRAKITIVFETHGMGTIQQHNEWNAELLDKIADALELPESPAYSPMISVEYPLVTFDVVAVEKLTEEQE